MKPVSLLFTLLILTLLSVCAPQSNNRLVRGRVVRAGVNQNEPKVFLVKNGATSVFFDLLEQSAQKENWGLTYIPCEWEGCPQALSAGQIDIMPGVAYHSGWDLKFDFYKIPAADSWSHIFAAPTTEISREDQLINRKNAVLGDFFHQTCLDQLIQAFEFPITILPAKAQEEAFASVQNGAIDAVLTNLFFGDYFYQKYGLVKTQIIFNTTTLYYATAHGKNQILFDTIDRYLSSWHDDPDSPYATTLNRWLYPSKSSGQWARIAAWMGGIGLLRRRWPEHPHQYYRYRDRDERNHTVNRRQRRKPLFDHFSA